MKQHLATIPSVYVPRLAEVFLLLWEEYACKLYWIRRPAVYGEQTLRSGLVSETQPSETLREEMLPGFH